MAKAKVEPNKWLTHNFVLLWKEYIGQDASSSQTHAQMTHTWRQWGLQFSRPISKFARCGAKPDLTQWACFKPNFVLVRLSESVRVDWLSTWTWYFKKMDRIGLKVIRFKTFNFLSGYDGGFLKPISNVVLYSLSNLPVFLVLAFWYCFCVNRIQFICIHGTIMTKFYKLSENYSKMK